MVIDCRPREGGDPVSFVESRWIPAFAGMTAAYFFGSNTSAAEFMQ